MGRSKRNQRSRTDACDRRKQRERSQKHGGVGQPIRMSLDR
jgi:hypothetical protein